MNVPDGIDTIFSFFAPSGMPGRSIVTVVRPDSHGAGVEVAVGVGAGVGEFEGVQGGITTRNPT